tara:strand:- start:1 stop:249 length:249 start_codon:yes stop_codon:yes gene_type:complete
MESQLEIELANAKIDRKAKLSAEWYARNKLRLQTSYNCECGGKWTKSNLSSHELSKRHLSYIDKMVARLHRKEHFDLDNLND